MPDLLTLRLRPSGISKENDLNWPLHRGLFFACDPVLDPCAAQPQTSTKKMPKTDV